VSSPLLSADDLRRPAAQAVTRLCRQLINGVREAEARLGDPADGDALHDFRVALRRLRSALRSWREPLRGVVRGRERRLLRDVQRATGSGRDAEVGLAWLDHRRSCAPEHAAGTEWIARRWTARLARTRALLEGEERARLRRAVEKLERRLAQTAPVDDPRSFAEALAAATLASAQDLAARLAAIAGPQDREPMHAARIAAKRLRYLVEPVRELDASAAELVDTGRSLQTLLGELNDTAVIAEELGAALAGSATERAQRIGGLVRSGYVDRARREAWFTEWPGLIELLRLLADERAALYARLEREWLEPGPAALRTRACTLASALRALKQPEACSG
jgi:CHAD domain-containing protein